MNSRDMEITPVPKGPKGILKGALGPKDTVYDYFEFKDLTSDYTEVMYAPRPPLCKLIWILWFFGMAVLGCYITVKLAKIYFDRETTTEITTEYTHFATFPAITICSLNQLNYTVLNETHSNETVHNINELFRLASDGRKFNKKQYEDLATNRDLFSKSRIRAERMIVDETYVFAGDEYKAESGSEVATENGYCMAFNHDGNWTQYMAGPSGGLVLTLDAQTKHYLPSTSSAGFRVIIHQPNETVLTSQYGYLVATGSHTDIKLTKRAVEKLEKPWGDCTDAQSEFNVYVKTSIPECSTNKTILAYKATCNCLPWWLYDRFNDTMPQIVTNYETVGGVDSEECGLVDYMSCNSQVIDSLNEANTMIDCLEPCSSIQYKTSITAATFPATITYYNDYLKQYVQYDSITVARRNLIYIRIFFEDIKIETEHQTPSYAFSNLIAEVGGTLDLFIGFSFFTVIQLGEIFFANLLNFSKRRKQRPFNSPEVEAQELGPPQPSSKEKDYSISDSGRSEGLASRVTRLFV